MQPPALEISKVTVRFKGHAVLDHVDFAIGRGDLLGLVGPNGAGKTTLFRAILGLQPYSGSISIFGRCQEDRFGLLPAVGYVPQNIGLEPSFPATAYDIVDMGILPDSRIARCATLTGSAPRRRYSGMRRDRRVREALSAVDMNHAADHRIGTLSGGEMQRVFIAKALVNDPAMLILDEPAASVDAGAQRRFYSVISRLNAENGITIAWSSHDLDAVSRIATHVACMNRCCSFHGSKEKFFADEKAVNMYTEASMQQHMLTHGGGAPRD